MGHPLRTAVATAVAVVVLAVSGAGSVQASDPVMQRAIAALGERSSYQVDVEMRTPYFGDEPVTLRRLQVNEPEPAHRDLVIVEGEVAVDTIATPDGQLMSTVGTPWLELDSGPGAREVKRTGAALRRLTSLSAQGLVLSEVGPEEIDARSVIRYTGTMPPGSGSVGSVDVWVDAAGGWLVKAVTDLRLPDGAEEPWAIPTLPVHEVTIVSRVDDPTIVISTSDVDASPTPIAPGDPALAPAVTRAFDSLRHLPSYVATLEDRTMGYASTAKTVVLNGARTTVLATYALGDAVTMQVMALPGSTRSRQGTDGAWAPADPDEVSCDGGPCDARTLTAFDRPLRDRFETFTLVADREMLDGVAVLHLRSEAGQHLSSGDDAPGTTDLWIAKDGGHLLRMDFDGQGVRSSLVISHIGDPANESIVADAPPSPSS
jgi:hypothetical protein